jgi:thioredoxin reductase
MWRSACFAAIMLASAAFSAVMLAATSRALHAALNAQRVCGTVEPLPECGDWPGFVSGEFGQACMTSTLGNSLAWRGACEAPRVAASVYAGVAVDASSKAVTIDVVFITLWGYLLCVSAITTVEVLRDAWRRGAGQLAGAGRGTREPLLPK